MLGNIKSKYILKIITSHISLKTQLNLVKYNKNIQLKLDLKLLHYKIFSGNFTTIFDNNNKIGKIYDEYKDKLIFEGEFSNGKKNGKGKEYDNNERLKFEGEYINGEKKGNGKEYYEIMKI